MTLVKVHLANRSYSITIGRGAVKKLPQGLKKFLPSNRVVVLTNSKIKRQYGSLLRNLLARSHQTSWITIPDGERFKNLKTVEAIYRQMVKSHADRKTGLIALGGGVVGDIGGFVAGTYLRGIPYVQIPTTLLAQVDSSVGGKTGVDLPSGKNLVGAFYQPAWVLIDTRFLSTLPRREFLCGMAEVVKYGLIRDEKLFRFIEKNVGKILSLDHNSLAYLIKRSCEIKAAIVSRDERESGLRSLLNFGHTVGHAIETLSGYRAIRHGEAISRGMVFAAMVSHQRGLCGKEVLLRTQNIFRALGLPTQWPPYSKKEYARAMAVDKKGVSGQIRFVMVKRIGKAVCVPLPIKEIIKYI